MMRWALILVGFTTLWAVGCQSGDPKYTIHGEVTWEGKPVERGHISFIPLDPSHGPDAGPITQGRYSVPVRAGAMRVEIDADRATGPVDPTMGLEVRESYIPEEYNVKSELEITITPDGDRKFDFALPR
jgi:hypothetical protein